MQPQKPSFNIYEKVTSIIIEKLEAGTVPWRQPWTDLGPPMNLLTRRHYSGINYLMLSCLPYEQPYYLTYNQVKCTGGKVRQGEKGHIIVFRKQTESVDEKTSKVSKQFKSLYYFVFNVAQCTELPDSLFPPHPAKRDNDPIKRCEWVVEGYETCPDIHHGDADAYYIPSQDFVNVPWLHLFETSEAYYSVLFHELIHSTGHVSRLNRSEVMGDKDFGSVPYSIEELVAEIGACYLNAYCKIPFETMDNNAAYIENWLKPLKRDKKFIIHASHRAQKAVDYILGIDRSSTFFEALPGEII